MARKSRRKRRLLTGNDLIARMKTFLDKYAGLRSSLKVTTTTSSVPRDRRRDLMVSVHVVRCQLLEHFLDVLESAELVGDIKNDHNMVALFLHEALNPGDDAELNKANDSGLEIDVHLFGRPAEVKTARNVDIPFVRYFVSVYFRDMVASQGDKEAWWLAFFSKRSDAEDIIGSGCAYYLTAIEIPTNGLEADDCEAVAITAMNMSQATHKRVHEEDELDASILLQSVDNIVPMDRMREKMTAMAKALTKALAEKDQALAEKDQALAEKDQALAEKDQALSEKDQALANYAKENAELKKRFGIDE